MGKHFSAVKKKTRFAALVNSLLLAVGVGLVTVAALLLIFKLLVLPLLPWYYLSGVITALAAGSASYIILMPSDSRLAKRLDEEHSLDEKVRTMVEFSADESPFARLQREDADEKLGNVKFSPWRKKQWISALLVFSISVISLTGAILVPTRAEPGEGTISDFDKAWILADLADIISIVEGSLILDELKTESLDELNSLVDVVNESDYMSEMKKKAIDVIISINSSLIYYNGIVTVGTQLRSSLNGDISELGEYLESTDSVKASAKLRDYAGQASSGDAELAYLIADEFSAALISGGVARETDAYRMASSFSEAIRGGADIDAAFSSLILNLTTELILENMNKMVISTVTTRLADLFGIIDEDLKGEEGAPDIELRPPVDTDGSDDTLPDDDDNQDKPNTGAPGTGNVIYGSNDKIYDPNSNEYVTYGELLAEYNARANEKLREGDMPPELIKFAEKYFAVLSGYNNSTEGN